MKELTATERELEEYKARKRSVTLTCGQWITLNVYLLMSTGYRKGEQETWEKEAERKGEDGEPIFKSAASNAEFWEKMNRDLEIIRSIIDRT